MSLGRDAAGKTGTTNDSASVWFVGFTPDLSAAVATWDPRGNARKYAMKNLTIGGHYFGQVFGSTLPGPIWKRAMLAALAAGPRRSSTWRPSTASAPTSRRRPRPPPRRRARAARRPRAARRRPAKARRPKPTASPSPKATA